MNDRQLGLDPMIQQSDDKYSLEIIRKDKTEQLNLTKLIKKQALIVDRSTTCWKAYRDGDNPKTPIIVKDS